MENENFQIVMVCCAILLVSVSTFIGIMVFYDVGSEDSNSNEVKTESTLAESVVMQEYSNQSKTLSSDIYNVNTSFENISNVSFYDNKTKCLKE